MLIIFAALLAAGPIPDLDRALANYATLAAETDNGADARWSAIAADNVCRIALRHTVVEQTQDAADAIIAYQGPRADRLKLSCALYFRMRAR